MAKGNYEGIYQPFKHWCEKGNIKFISDLHLGDEDMAWRGVCATDIIHTMNEALHPGDTLVVLGDIGCYPGLFYNLLKKGVYKVLICGNHDKPYELRKFFDEVYTGGLQISEKIYLSHEPTFVQGCLNIHGHDHDNAGIYSQILDDDGQTVIGAQYNLCCEGIYYTPISLKQIQALGYLKPIVTRHRQAIDYQRMHSINPNKINIEVDE